MRTPFFRNTFAQAVTIGVASLAALVVGCSGGNSNNIGSIYGLPQGCLPPAGDQVALVYPLPNATNVPNAVSEVAVAVVGPTALPTNYFVEIVNGSQSYPYASVGNAVPAATLPSPYVTPVAGTATPLYYVSQGNGVTLPSNSTVQVYLGEHASSCTTNQLLGSFTVSTPGPTATNQSQNSFAYEPLGTTSTLAPTSVASPYVASAPAFTLSISEPNYSGKFTASMVYFSSLPNPCYTVSMDTVTGTTASFIPYTLSGSSVLCSIGGTIGAAGATEGALIQDTNGNTSLFYFKPPTYATGAVSLQYAVNGGNASLWPLSAPYMATANTFIVNVSEANSTYQGKFTAIPLYFNQLSPCITVTMDPVLGDIATVAPPTSVPSSPNPACASAFATPNPSVSATPQPSPSPQAIFFEDQLGNTGFFYFVPYQL